MEGLRFFAMTSGEMWVYIYTGGLSPGPNHNTINKYIYIFLSMLNYLGNISRIMFLSLTRLCRETLLKTSFDTSIHVGQATQSAPNAM